ncbi:MAG: TfoX/Sxy family protein [Betaproteobacteria bacterium]
MAASDPEFARYCCELLERAGRCVARRMFGGWGISTEGLTIAILVDLGEGETLWLKADEASGAQFEAAACKRFTYLAKGVPKSMNYYAAPSQAMESRALMRPWARLALEAALRAHAAKPVKRPAAKPPKPKPLKPRPPRP